MPGIRQYENPIEGLNPSERGSSAFSSAAQASAIAGRSIQGSYEDFGRSLGGGIAAVGDAYTEHVARAEIAKGAADMAVLQDNLNTSWRDLASKADPNDTTLRQRFLELNEDALQHYTEGFQTEAGKQWASQQVGHLRTHMYETTAADEASRAGSAMLQNLDVLKNRASNLVMKDPTALDAALGLIDRSVDAIVGANPNMDPSLANRARTELLQQLKDDVVKSAAVGMIDANPAAGKAALAEGRFADYLDGDTVKALSSYATTKEHADAEAQRAQVQEERRQQKDRADGAAAAISASIIQPNGSLAIPADFYQNIVKYAQLPEADAGQARAMIDMGRAITNDLEKGTPAITDPNTYSNFKERMILDPGNPRFLSAKEVYQARANGRLSDKDFSFFNSAVSTLGKDPELKAATKDFTAFVASYKGYITKSSFLKVDAYGDQRFYEFQRDAQEYYDYAKARGANDEAIRADIVKTLPKYQIGQRQALDAMRQQSHSTGLQPLPMVQSGGSQPTATSSPSAVSAARMEELRRIAHGGK